MKVPRFQAVTGPSGHVLSMKGERKFVAPFTRSFLYLLASDSRNRTSPSSQLGGDILTLLDRSNVKDHVKQILGSLAALRLL
jgi:hypothetical protein